MKTIGKEGNLGGEEREEKNLEETQGRNQWQRLKYETDGQAAAYWLKPAPGFLQLQILFSVQLSSFFFSVGRADKGAIFTLMAKSCPLSLGEQGASQVKTAS